MIYCDTSLLIAALTPETGSAAVQRWLSNQSPSGLAISPWVNAEIASAVALKGRIGDLAPQDQRDVLATWRRMRRGLHIEAIRTRDFVPAANLIARPAINLRSADALHLAVARDRGFALATLDRGLERAAVTLAVKTIDLSGIDAIMNSYY